MKMLINNVFGRRTTNGRPLGTPKNGRAMLAPTGTPRPYGDTNRWSNREGRRGFTMVELVISLTIIGIVTLASIGIMTAQTKSNVVTAQTIEATNITENAIECFRYAVNVGGDNKSNIEHEFSTAFAKTGYSLSYDSETDEYFVDSAGLKAYINLDFADGNKITVTTYNSSGDKILEKSYTK